MNSEVRPSGKTQGEKVPTNTMPSREGHDLFMVGGTVRKQDKHISRLLLRE